MMFSNSALTAFLLVASSPTITPFVPVTQQVNHELLAARVDSKALFLSPQDLTDYMAKAHEEKLRAIKSVEQKKDEQIKVCTIDFIKL